MKPRRKYFEPEDLHVLFGKAQITLFVQLAGCSKPHWRLLKLNNKQRFNVKLVKSGAYQADEAGEKACNLYIDCIDIEIQTWPTFTTFSNMPNMDLTGTFM